MLFRILLFFVFTSGITFGNGYASPNEKENSDENTGHIPKPRLKEKQHTFSTSKHPSKSTSSPKKTPERIFWHRIKEDLALSQGSSSLSQGSSSLTDSPFVRQIIRRHNPDTFFDRFEFDGKTVYSANILFDPDAMVLSKSGEWETNLERMKRGRSPIGHKGIVSIENRTRFSHKQVYDIQRPYRIDMQHMTQKDTGSAEDPICEMTHIAHMGYDTYFLLEYDQLIGEMKIVYSNLTKEQATTHLAQNPHYFLASNVLHFREGKSLIDRTAFRIWRENYWKYRAKMLEATPNNEEGVEIPGSQTPDYSQPSSLETQDYFTEKRVVAPSSPTFDYIKRHGIGTQGNQRLFVTFSEEGFETPDSQTPDYSQPSSLELQEYDLPFVNYNGKRREAPSSPTPDYSKRRRQQVQEHHSVILY